MSKYSTLLMPILNEILIGEIGEANIAPLKWKKNNRGYYVFEVNINDSNELVEVMFDPMWVSQEAKQYYLPNKLWDSKNVWNIAYVIGGTDTQFAQTNLKLLLQILSTIIDIVKDFIASKSPDAIYIFATEKYPFKNQKSNLYDAYIKNNISQIPDYYSESRRGGVLIIKK